MESNQYLPLTACSPSLALISLQDSAGNSGIEPRGTNKQSQIAHGCVRRNVSTKNAEAKEIKEEGTIKSQLYNYNYFNHLVVCSGVVSVGVKKHLNRA